MSEQRPHTIPLASPVSKQFLLIRISDRTTSTSKRRTSDYSYTTGLAYGARTLPLRHRLLELFDSFCCRNYHTEIPLRLLRMLMGCVDLGSTCVDLLTFGPVPFWFWVLTFFLLCPFF